MSHPKSRSNRKKAFMKEAEIMFDEVDDWYEQNPNSSFEEIERDTQLLIFRPK